MNVGQLLANAARRHPDRPAVTWGDRRLDYSTLLEHTPDPLGDWATGRVYAITATVSIAFSYVSLYTWFSARERPASRVAHPVARAR